MRTLLIECRRDIGLELGKTPIENLEFILGLRPAKFGEAIGRIFT